MEKYKTNKEKNDSTKFAFLPQMVIEHLNDVKAVDSNKASIKEEISNPKTSQTIVFDPMADPFEGTIIEIKPIVKKKSKIKSIKTVNSFNLETQSNISENRIMEFIKNIRFNFFNF